MEPSQVDAALEGALAVASTGLLGALSALWWFAVGRRSLARRRQRRTQAAALIEAQDQRREATDALARVSREFTRMMSDTRTDVEAAVAAERQQLMDEVGPLRGALAELLKSIPEAHVLTPGLRLVGKQLDSVVERWRASPAPLLEEPPASSDVEAGGNSAER